MALLLDGRGVMGIARYKQKGWRPEWQQNFPPGRGTQVDSRRCINGYYWHFALVFLQVPPLYSAPPIVAAALNNASVTQCGN